MTVPRRIAAFVAKCGKMRDFRRARVRAAPVPDGGPCAGRYKRQHSRLLRRPRLLVSCIAAALYSPTDKTFNMSDALGDKHDWIDAGDCGSLEFMKRVNLKLRSRRHIADPIQLVLVFSFVDYVPHHSGQLLDDIAPIRRHIPVTTVGVWNRHFLSIDNHDVVRNMTDVAILQDAVWAPRKTRFHWETGSTLSVDDGLAFVQSWARNLWVASETLFIFFWFRPNSLGRYPRPKVTNFIYAHPAFPLAGLIDKVSAIAAARRAREGRPAAGHGDDASEDDEQHFSGEEWSGDEWDF